MCLPSGPNGSCLQIVFLVWSTDFSPNHDSRPHQVSNNLLHRQLRLNCGNQCGTVDLKEALHPVENGEGFSVEKLFSCIRVARLPRIALYITPCLFFDDASWS